MGFFNRVYRVFKKQNENVIQENNGAKEYQLNLDRWDSAFVANANVYDNENEPSRMIFTLTETVDTILPIDPQNMYESAINGEIEDFRLWLVSTQPE